MTHKSRIYAHIDTNPLPCEPCRIDIKLKCGSVLTNCLLEWNPFDKEFSLYFRNSYIGEGEIKSWRLSK